MIITEKMLYIFTEELCRVISTVLIRNRIPMMKMYRDEGVNKPHSIAAIFYLVDTSKEVAQAKEISMEAANELGARVTGKIFFSRPPKNSWSALLYHPAVDKIFNSAYDKNLPYHLQVSNDQDDTWRRFRNIANETRGRNNSSPNLVCRVGKATRNHRLKEPRWRPDPHHPF
jgi:hypothetical protein